MKNPNHEMADAIRDVTASVQKAIDEGYRSRAIDVDDLVEVLLAIADRLDPPVEPPEQNRVAPGLACPECGEADADRLIGRSKSNLRGAGTEDLLIAKEIVVMPTDRG